MPCLIAPWISLLTGIGFAWASADELSRSGKGAVGSRGLIVAILFGVALPAPAVAFFLTVAPDWSWAYLISPGEFSRGLEFGVTLISGAAPPVGFLLCADAAAARRFRPVARLAAIPMTAIAALLAAFTPRWAVYATYSQYHGSFGTRPLGGSWLGYALLWSVFVLAAATLWTLQALIRSSDPSRSR